MPSFSGKFEYRKHGGAPPAAAALLMTEQSFRKIMGNRDLWMLKAALDQNGMLVQQQVA